MKQAILILVSLIPLSLFCQTQSISNKKFKAQILDESTFRILLSSPLSENRETYTLAMNYERHISNNIYLNSKFGLGLSIKKFGPVENPYQTSLHIYGALEAKYYFVGKEKKDKIAYPYFSIEQNVFSNPIALKNQIKKEAFEGATATFLNVGYQLQYKQLFLSAFFGVQILYKDFAVYDVNRSLRTIHGGVNIGYVF